MVGREGDGMGWDGDGDGDVGSYIDNKRQKI